MVAKGTVPESVLKKRKRNEELQVKRAAAASAAKKDNKLKRRAAFKRAESYVKEYRAKESEEVRLKRVAKEQGGFYFKGEAKVLFVIRIRGLMDVHPKTKKILQLMRLRQMNNGVFMKVNKASINMLKRVEPYVTYGEPNLKSVRELIYKRGFGKVGAGKQRIALTDNSIIEGELGKHGIVCIEDLIHEIITMGPKFKEANNFLWPFQLNAPKGALAKKRIHYNEGGQAGNREEKINNLIHRMN